MSRYIAVIGESHVRTFATSTNYLPLFVGPGLRTCFVTDGIAQQTTEKCLAVVAALPHEMPLLFTMTEPDIRLHLENRYGTRDSFSNEEQIKRSASRYRNFLGRVIAQRNSSGQIAVMQSIPSGNPAHTQLARDYNALLRRVCSELNVLFLDIWDQLITKDGHALNPAMSADGIHLSQHTSSMATTWLKSAGLIAVTAPDGENYRWRYRYNEKVPDGPTIRIWGDERITQPSVAAANSRLADTIANILGSRNIIGRRIAVHDGGEGYLPIQLLKHGAEEVLLSDANENSAGFARQLILLFDRPKISVEEKSELQSRLIPDLEILLHATPTNAEEKTGHAIITCATLRRVDVRNNFAGQFATKLRIRAIGFSCIITLENYPLSERLFMVARSRTTAIRQILQDALLRKTKRKMR